MQYIDEKIVYENGDFYAFEVSKGKIEIRQDGPTYSELWGVVPNIERAKRFIDRMAQRGRK